MTTMIVSYLERTANFEDTLDAITYWWQTEEQKREFELRRSLVQRALERMRRAGEITLRRVSDGRVMYGLRRRHGRKKNYSLN